MEKKNNIIIGIAIVILFILIIVLLINNKNTPKGDFEEITYNQIQKKIENKEDFVIVLSQTTCSHCTEYKPIVKQIAKKYNITMYYLDYDKYEEETMNKIIDSFNFDGGTPTTFFYKDGKETSVMNRLTGSVSEDKVIANLKKLEYIKEAE